MAEIPPKCDNGEWLILPRGGWIIKNIEQASAPSPDGWNLMSDKDDEFVEAHICLECSERYLGDS